MVASYAAHAMTPLEIAWFAPSCIGDTARLGVDDPGRRATFSYNQRVVTLADRLGFRNVLIPSSFVPGMDPWTLAAALGPTTATTRLLPAVRVGEFDPPMFARAAKVLQQTWTAGSRSTSSPATVSASRLSSEERYAGRREAMSLLRSLLDR